MGKRLPCSWCRALKWIEEPPGMCWSGCQVQHRLSSGAGGKAPFIDEAITPDNPHQQRQLAKSSPPPDMLQVLVWIPFDKQGGSLIRSYSVPNPNTVRGLGPPSHSPSSAS
ncbi:hypothetical protein NPIL_593071 [Nephila pilipes]|uniref:Uncharacterized protein n=1 Tax=Nephila pilipes TaxID=299642 RepID=A0A8X6MRS3_NEPPI|nr:hypothetical protein NPIL_593071 [Nephila pilipes]